MRRTVRLATAVAALAVVAAAASCGGDGDDTPPGTTPTANGLPGAGSGAGEADGATAPIPVDLPECDHPGVMAAAEIILSRAEFGEADADLVESDITTARQCRWQHESGSAFLIDIRPAEMPGQLPDPGPLELGGYEFVDDSGDEFGALVAIGDGGRHAAAFDRSYQVLVYLPEALLAEVPPDDLIDTAVTVISSLR